MPGALRGLKDAIQTKIVWHCLFLHIRRDRTNLVITVFALKSGTLHFVCTVANLEIKIRSKCIRSSGSSRGLMNERGKDSRGRSVGAPRSLQQGQLPIPGVMGNATSHLRSQQTERAPGSTVPQTCAGPAAVCPRASLLPGLCPKVRFSGAGADPFRT